MIVDNVRCGQVATSPWRNTQHGHGAPTNHTTATAITTAACTVRRVVPPVRTGLLPTDLADEIAEGTGASDSDDGEQGRTHEPVERPPVDVVHRGPSPFANTPRGGEQRDDGRGDPERVGVEEVNHRGGDPPISHHPCRRFIGRHGVDLTHGSDRHARGRGSGRSGALVVGGFLGDGHVVGVDLLAAGGGDPHEAGASQRVERGRAGVAHARSAGRRRAGRRRRRACRRRARGPRCPRARACGCRRRRDVRLAAGVAVGADRPASRPASPCRGSSCSGGPRTAPSRPGLSSVPASSEPSITVAAPAAIALTMSPE